MKLSALAAKPQLIELTLDDADTIASYGEPLTFHTWDRQPLEVFMKLASVTQDSAASVIDIVRTLILNEDGKQIIQGEVMLPTDTLMGAIGKIVELLGKK